MMMMKMDEDDACETPSTWIRPRHDDDDDDVDDEDDACETPFIWIRPR